MMTGRKRWWRAVAIAAVGGGVISGWFGLVRPQSAKSDQTRTEETTWTRAPVSAPAAPTVSEAARAPEAAPSTGYVTPAGAALPIPVPGSAGPVVPTVPVSNPVMVPVPPLPSVPQIEPVSGPRAPDAGLVGDKSMLPVVPALPPTELPPLPTPPKTPEVKPIVPPVDMVPKPPAPFAVPPMPPAPAPVVPPLSMSTAEPPKALPLPPAPPTMPLVLPVDVGTMMPVVPPAPVGPGVPASPVVPQPTPITPAVPSVKTADPMQPVLPVKPDSDLKPINPGNTLNPAVPPVSPVAPVVPVVPGGTGRDTPGTVVDRPKPPEPNFGATDKFVFPLPVKPTPTDPTLAPRDDTMFNLTTTAAFAVLGGALLAAEKAHAFPTVPAAPMIPMPGAGTPGTLVRADDKTEVEKLKTDLAAANKKIEALETQVKKLTELLTGKKDELGNLINPNDPGAAADVTRLKDKVAALENEIKTLKTQTTTLKPSVGVPEVKPKGIVKVVNEYPVEISMVINEKSYRIAPATKIEVEVPAGDFTYQLLQSGVAVTKSVIKDKETVTLRIK